MDRRWIVDGSLMGKVGKKKEKKREKGKEKAGKTVVATTVVEFTLACADGKWQG